MAKKKKAKSAAPAKNTLSAERALKKLQAGNERFLKHDPINYQTHQQREPLGGGQQPYAAILSCADSRVSPEIMFNAGLNELFVIRVAGNIADTTSIASIEYAVDQLNTNLIVVLGHEGCGAVKTALASHDETLDLGYNLNTLLGHIAPAVSKMPQLPKSAKKRHAERLEKTVKLNAELVAGELKARSPIIASARGVKLVWGYYHLVSGAVEFSDFV